MKIKISSGRDKELREILEMPNGPRRKFWLLAVIARVSGQEASVAARELSCEEISQKYDLGES